MVATSTGPVGGRRKQCGTFKRRKVKTNFIDVRATADGFGSLAGALVRCGFDRRRLTARLSTIRPAGRQSGSLLAFGRFAV